jgi:hypothetical protein
MGLRTPPVDKGGEEETIHVWEASIDSSSQAQKISSCSCEVRGVALVPLKRSVSLGMQRAQALQKNNVRIDNGVKTLYMKRK